MGWFKGSGSGKGSGGSGKNESFSTPFMEIGDGNLSLPFINSRYLASGGVVRFGVNNLFPQLLDQMYYTSPLNAAVIDYKTNAIAGGGFTLTAKDQNDGSVKTDIYAFIKRMKLNKSSKRITRELVAHERVYYILKFRRITDSEGNFLKLKPLKAEFISSSKIRVKQNKKWYGISSDWSVSTNQRSIVAYHPNNREEEQLYVYENNSLGQDYYPIPAYSTALNWCFLDGESSYLHKTNIKESIFPSFALMFPKKPSGKEDLKATKDTIEGAKGAQNAGRIFTFFANKKEQLPELVTIPKSNNDSLFNQTDERIDNKICQAHVIDPILMGIRVSGKLGSGSDIKQSYVIFEKNTVMPKRAEVEEIVNDILDIFGIKAEYKLNDFQIINETIVAVEGEDAGDAEKINKLSPLLATKVLEEMTPNEKRALAGKKPMRGGDQIERREEHKGGQTPRA